MLTLRVALASNNISGLENELMSLSTPGTSDMDEVSTGEKLRSTFPRHNLGIEVFSSANGFNSTVISPNGD
ncbi:hypothetical protein C8R44DRAFT_886676 [Mycena epipterygia]|nr:hypothetical protein C8R44DRAFT_886676 [Mycena epipterygia]